MCYILKVDILMMNKSKLTSILGYGNSDKSFTHGCEGFPKGLLHRSYERH
jgi:hypothetical protein